MACEGKFYGVHKLVLASCSDYFFNMFEKTPCKHPVVVLKDIQSKEIEALLSYMYDGVVSVAQTDLARLISAAEVLQIKGLAVPDEPPSSSIKKAPHTRCSSDDRSSPQQKRARREEMSSRNNLQRSRDSSPSESPIIVKEGKPGVPRNDDQNESDGSKSQKEMDFRETPNIRNRDESVEDDRKSSSPEIEVEKVSL